MIGYYYLSLWLIIYRIEFLSIFPYIASVVLEGYAEQIQKSTNNWVINDDSMRCKIWLTSCGRYIEAWIAEKWMVITAILGEHSWFSYVEAEYSAVSLGAILYKENFSSYFYLVHRIHFVYQNCCRSSPEALGNWNNYFPWIITYSISLFR